MDFLNYLIQPDMADVEELLQWQQQAEYEYTQTQQQGEDENGHN
jgi:hypothetical protein